MDLAEYQGWKVNISKDGHYKFYAPTGFPVLIRARAALGKDENSFQNALSDLKRHGFKFVIEDPRACGHVSSAIANATLTAYGSKEIHLTTQPLSAPDPFSDAHRRLEALSTHIINELDAISKIVDKAKQSTSKLQQLRELLKDGIG